MATVRHTHYQSSNKHTLSFTHTIGHPPTHSNQPAHIQPPTHSHPPAHSNPPAHSWLLHTHCCTYHIQNVSHLKPELCSQHRNYPPMKTSPNINNNNKTILLHCPMFIIDPGRYKDLITVEPVINTHSLNRLAFGIVHVSHIVIVGLQFPARLEDMLSQQRHHIRLSEDVAAC